MRKFNNFIFYANLLEIPLSSSRFTWSREGRVISHSLIDKFLVSNEGDEAFENTRTVRQVCTSSDHFPLLLEASSFEWGP